MCSPYTSPGSMFTGYEWRERYCQTFGSSVTFSAIVAIISRPSIATIAQCFYQRSQRSCAFKCTKGQLCNKRFACKATPNLPKVDFDLETWIRLKWLQFLHHINSISTAFPTIKIQDYLAARNLTNQKLQSGMPSQSQRDPPSSETKGRVFRLFADHVLPG